jgi:hypothetical protein
MPSFGGQSRWLSQHPALYDPKKGEGKAHACANARFQPLTSGLLVNCPEFSIVVVKLILLSWIARRWREPLPRWAVRTILACTAPTPRSRRNGIFVAALDRANLTQIRLSPWPTFVSNRMRTRVAARANSAAVNSRSLRGVKCWALEQTHFPLQASNLEHESKIRCARAPEQTQRGSR